MNDAIMLQDQHLGQRVGEATNRESSPVSSDPSAAPLSDEASAHQSDESASSHEATSEDRVPRSDAPMKKCVACGDYKGEANVMTAPCTHTYCSECINRLFDHAIEDEANYPPRCCRRTITLENTGLWLSADTYRKFQERSEEYSTTNRTYCSDPECVTFIRAKATVGEKAECPTCQKWTCIVCKAAAHEGDCPEDPAAQSFMTAVVEAGFQQCRECKRVIELAQGCNHITCICGAQFCYVCGTQWKTCSCANWNEQNLQRQVDEMHDGNWDQFALWAVENVMQIDFDGRIEWLDRAQPIPEYVDDFVHPGGAFETQEDLLRYIRDDEFCVHERWEVLEVGEHDEGEQCVLCDFCARHQHPYLLQCRECLARICVGCGRYRFVLP